MPWSGDKRPSRLGLHRRHRELARLAFAAAAAAEDLPAPSPLPPEIKVA